MRPLSHAPLLLTLAMVGCFSPNYASPGYYCDTTAMPPHTCPDGQSCVANRCTTTAGAGGGFNIPKTTSYMGNKLDPMLSNESACTDAALEPNDSIATAVTGLDTQLNLMVDAASPKLQMMAICPTGDNPKSNGGHDVDFYQFDAPASLNAVVEIFYDIQYGDLDVGIFRPDGSLVAGDGSAVSNGCVASTLPAGQYYVGVGGAGNMDSNRYDLRIRFYSSSTTNCSGSGTTDDMGS